MSDTAEDAVEQGVSVGTAAARLGVTTSTLRSWGSRYGIGPSLRTAGGHRRYSGGDLALLDRFQREIQAGVAPAAAAASVLGGTTATDRRGAGPGGRVLAVPGADHAARGLARAAGQLDLDGAEDILLEGLRDRGAVRTWDELLRPVLVAVGNRWAESGEAIEVEHVLSEAALGALRRRRAELPPPHVERPVLLAAAPDDQHTVVLHALAVGLAERGVPARVIGAQVPVAALATAVRRLRPSAVFVSCVVAGTGDPDELVAGLPRSRPPTLVVVGGVGWPDELPVALRRAGSLDETLNLLTDAV